MARVGGREVSEDFPNRFLTPFQPFPSELTQTADCQERPLTHNPPPAHFFSQLVTTSQLPEPASPIQQSLRRSHGATDFGMDNVRSAHAASHCSTEKPR
jgi:hypothetical protein